MIFVLGNICRDTSFYVDRLPLAGETVNATATRAGLGGKGLNQAVAASSAGAERDAHRRHRRGLGRGR